jgi:hypothetical protein
MNGDCNDNDIVILSLGCLISFAGIIVCNGVSVGFLRMYYTRMIIGTIGRKKSNDNLANNLA